MHDAIKKATGKQNEGERPTFIPRSNAFSETAKSAEDAADSTDSNLLHHASGTVHNVKPAGSPSYNNFGANGSNGQQSYNNDTKQAATKKKTKKDKHNKAPKWFKHWLNRGYGSRYNPNEAPLSVAKLIGPGSIGGKLLPPSSTGASTTSGGGMSPAFIIIALVVVAALGWYIYHKAHGTAAADKVATKEANKEE